MNYLGDPRSTITKSRHLDAIVASFRAVMGKAASPEELRKQIVDALVRVAISDHDHISLKTKQSMRRNRDRLTRLALRFEKVKKELRRELKKSHSLPLTYPLPLPANGTQGKGRKVGQWIESIEDAELTEVAMVMSQAIGWVLRRDGQADRAVDFVLHWITIANPSFRRWSSLSELLSTCFGKHLSSDALRMMAKRRCQSIPVKRQP
jgi:hypothetical protein